MRDLEITILRILLYSTVPGDVQRKVSTVEIIPSQKIGFFDQQTLL